MLYLQGGDDSKVTEVAEKKTYKNRNFLSQEPL